MVVYLFGMMNDMGKIPLVCKLLSLSPLSFFLFPMNDEWKLEKITCLLLTLCLLLSASHSPFNSYVISTTSFLFSLSFIQATSYTVNILPIETKHHHHPVNMLPTATKHH